jgi:hypothetical protein
MASLPAVSQQRPRPGAAGCEFGQQKVIRIFLNIHEACLYVKRLIKNRASAKSLNESEAQWETALNSQRTQGRHPIGLVSLVHSMTWEELIYAERT